MYAIPGIGQLEQSAETNIILDNAVGILPAGSRT